MILPAPSCVALAAVSFLPNLPSKAALITLFCTGFVEVADNAVSTVTLLSLPSLPLGNVKFNTTLLAVPLLVTLALLPAAPVVTVPTSIVAAVPLSPLSPLSPFAPCGIVKSSTAADVVPLLTTFADVPAAPVVTVPILIVAAVPAAPVAPWIPCGPGRPCGPVSPLGPRSPCGPGRPCGPLSPVSPLAPVSPLGPFSAANCSCVKSA